LVGVLVFFNFIKPGCPFYFIIGARQISHHNYFMIFSFVFLNTSHIMTLYYICIFINNKLKLFRVSLCKSTMKRWAVFFFFFFFFFFYFLFFFVFVFFFVLFFFHFFLFFVFYAFMGFFFCFFLCIFLLMNFFCLI
jgi:hypothetical protein